MLFLLVLLVLDGVYLYSTRAFSKDMIRRMQGDEKTPMRIAGIVFTYACIAALLYGVILRENRSVTEAFLLGFFTYGIYDGTNYAIFKNYPLSFAIMDTLWGGTLFALTTWIVRKFR
jgi:uncharacterized membrane protein